jgi:exonuclease VII small subunit
MCTAASEFLTEVLASFAMASSAYAGAREQLQQAQEEVAELRRRLAAQGGD